ncbi:phosphoglycolate phosphatase [Sulfurimonas sp.]|uniref:phosphoglycolate phosphatase n=1 Tax=Sulfurimonas sp. TaxID=2022749 RepID=UPI00356267D6
MKNNNILKNKKLIIFDFDGTLIDSGPDLAHALNYTLSQLELKTYSEEIIHGWVGNGAKTLVQRGLLGKTDIDDQDIDAEVLENALNIFLTYYSEHVCIKTITYPNVSETLKTLKNDGYMMAIVTNKPHAFIKPILEKLELDDLFEYYIGGDSLKEKKPSPAPLLHVCETLNIDINDSVMVGDSKNDILSANACSMQSIGVSYGYNYGEDINIYNPTVVLNDFKDILRVIK